MIVSHEYRFVIAVPVGLDAGDWLTRIDREGETGYLEIIGSPNGVCVPEGCEKYRRYFVDAPQHRLPTLWLGRSGTPWEGPVQIQSSVEEWLKWYLWGMRKKYMEQGVLAAPNGWGMRGEDGPWMYFDHPSILLRTVAGVGVSLNGPEAPWGRANVHLLRMQEATKGWRDLYDAVGRGERKLSVSAAGTLDLLRWHVPVMQHFYELPDELVKAYFGENAYGKDTKMLLQ